MVGGWSPNGEEKEQPAPGGGNDIKTNSLKMFALASSKPLMLSGPFSTGCPVHSLELELV